MTDVPELYISNDVANEPAMTHSVWGEYYIVLNARYLEGQPETILDEISFTLGSEVARIRLGHVSLLNEVLITFVLKFPLLANPILNFRIFSRDRYGAVLEPFGFMG
jgi:hypothetical protein